MQNPFFSRRRPNRQVWATFLTCYYVYARVQRSSVQEIMEGRNEPFVYYHLHCFSSKCLYCHVYMNVVAFHESYCWRETQQVFIVTFAQVFKHMLEKRNEYQLAICAESPIHVCLLRRFSPQVRRKLYRKLWFFCCLIPYQKTCILFHVYEKDQVQVLHYISMRTHTGPWDVLLFPYCLPKLLLLNHRDLEAYPKPTRRRLLSRSWQRPSMKTQRCWNGFSKVRKIKEKSCSSLRVK